MAILRRRDVVVEMPDGRILCKKVTTSKFNNLQGLIEFDISLVHAVYINVEVPDVTKELLLAIDSNLHDGLETLDTKNVTLFTFKRNKYTMYDTDGIFYLKFNNIVRFKEKAIPIVELIEKEVLTKTLPPSTHSDEVLVGKFRLKNVNDFQHACHCHRKLETANT